MKFKKLIGLCLVLLLFSFGCAGKTQQVTLTAYETQGVTLEGLHKTAESMCDADMISGKNCNKIVAAYEKARKVHMQVGEAIKVVAIASNTVQKQVAACKAKGDSKCDLTNLNLAYQSALEAYQKVSADALNTINEFIAIAKEAGLLGGAK